MGSARTIEEFEEYAGLSFRLRKAQDYTVRSEEPPNPKLDSNWAQEIYSWLVRIRLDSLEFPPESWNDFSFWYIGVHDENHNEIYRRDLSAEELEPLSLQQPEIELVCELQSGSIPAAWTVWPVSRSRGWLRKSRANCGRRILRFFLRKINEEHQTRRPTLRWDAGLLRKPDCLAKESVETVGKEDAGVFGA